MPLVQAASLRNLPPQAYILENRVTHARLLPTDSWHSFTYPTISLLLSLNALENHSLDLARGWIFGYGGLWCRLSGIRAAPYLTDQPGHSIKQKLQQVLAIHGHNSPLSDAWMMTMPSFIGFEGINPLTVYFCYKLGGEFWITVLEIHNTFGESHVHVLEVGRNEDKEPSTGFDHQWTFHREFHVSPFNDRSGFYTISVKTPSHPPMIGLDNTTNSMRTSLRPAVRVHLHTESTVSPGSTSLTPGPLKLTALLRPIAITPLTSLSLFLAVSRAPFALLLSFSRIVYHAGILHYKHRLDIYIRPEPYAVTLGWGNGAVPDRPQIIGRGVKWVSEGLLEKYARKCVEDYLTRKVEEIQISVTLLSSDPSVPARKFESSQRPLPLNSSEIDKRSLTISYMSPRFFTILFLSPSASHALLLGSTTERIFFPSSSDLFMATFSAPVSHDKDSHNPTILQRMRTRPIPHALLPPSIAIPPSHPLDANPIINIAIISALLFLEWLEAAIFRLIHARFVPGDEPWKQWERAASIYQGVDRDKPRDPVGSTRNKLGQK